MDVMMGTGGTQQRIDSMGMWGRLRLASRLARDPRVPGWAKAIVPGLAALYVVSPIDVIPDILLGIGQIDDIGVVGIAMVVTSRLLPRFTSNSVLLEHLDDLTKWTVDRIRTGPGGDIVETRFRVVERDAEVMDVGMSGHSRGCHR